MTTPFIGVIILMIVGVLYRWIPRVPSRQEVRKSIGALVLTILLPALTFRSLANASIGDGLWQVPLVAIATWAILATLAWWIYRVILRKRVAMPFAGSMIFAAAWSNATYLGIPILSAVLGETAVSYAVVYDLLALTPLLFVAGTIIGTELGTRGQRHRFVDGLTRLITLPPFIAAIAGLVWHQTGLILPEVIDQPLRWAGACVSPLMILSIGMALEPIRLRRLPFLAPAIILKLAVAPLVAWGMARAVLGMSGVSYAAVLLEASMPTMFLTMVFAEKFGLDEGALAEAIAISTALSMMSVPLIALLAL